MSDNTTNQPNVDAILEFIMKGTLTEFSKQNAWDEGFVAGVDFGLERNNSQEQSNPYKEDSEYSKAWDDGWEVGYHSAQNTNSADLSSKSTSNGKNRSLFLYESSVLQKSSVTDPLEQSPSHQSTSSNKPKS